MRPPDLESPGIGRGRTRGVDPRRGSVREGPRDGSIGGEHVRQVLWGESGGGCVCWPQGQVQGSSLRAVGGSRRDLSQRLGPRAKNLYGQDSLSVRLFTGVRWGVGCAKTVPLSRRAGLRITEID